MKLNLIPPHAIRICSCILIFMLLLFSACGGSNDSESTDQAGDSGTGGHSSRSISQFGITWYFDSELSLGTDYGQFTNGDYWVVGPVNVINIEPYPAQINGRSINGSMLNPPADGGSNQGYDSSLWNYPYSDASNVALGVSSIQPLLLEAGDFLFSSISTDPEPANNFGHIDTIAILTCLSSAPPAGSFRPGYCDFAQSLHNVAELDYSKLARLDPPTSVPLFSDVERAFERPWIANREEYTSNYLHPASNMSTYGREIANDVGIGSLMLNLDFDDSAKELLLIRFVQVGIDLYSIVANGGKDNFINNGGCHPGMKWPILFAGIVLNDDEMKNIGQKSGDYLYSGAYGPGKEPPDYIHFHEDDQTFYVAQFDIDITDGPDWNPDSRDAEAYPYDAADIGMPEWGIRHSDVPQVSNKYWQTVYRETSTATSWGGFVLAARIMGAVDIWNHQALFDYQDRFISIARGDSDPFGFNVPGERAGYPVWGSSFIANYDRDFVLDMWDLYRSSF